AVNNVEENRQSLSVNVSERWLFEYWLPHFRECIIEGQAQSIMASYNAINGTPNNINKYLLTDILKEKWGFEGFVVSDLGGVRSMVRGHEEGQMTYVDAVAQSIMAGCDFSDTEFREYIPEAVRTGKLDSNRLDDALYRVMYNRFRLGEFDPPEMVPYSSIPFSIIGDPEHRKLSLELAQKSIVLLKNENDFLPIDKNSVKTIAVIGPHADIFTAGGYSGVAKDPVTPLPGVKNKVATGTEILYTQGGEMPVRRRRNQPEPEPFDREKGIKEAVEIAEKADVVLLYIGTNLATEAEGRDRETLALPGNQQELVEAVVAVNPKTVVIEMNAGPLAVPWIKDNVPAMIEAWWAGEEGGNAIADVIFGNVNPGGKMPLTVYASDEQVPSQDEYDISKGFTYMYINGDPLFPFGHGLSYTSFEYSDLEFSTKEINTDGEITVSCQVKNTGNREGDEVVQMYIHDVESSVVRATKELRGFERISLEPGETETVELIIPGEKLSFYDENTHDFVVEPGEFEVMIGSSSADIRLKGEFEVVD
ncbi:MAG TPA: glycoside hydrolase family 3 C-terminal domain-containing protein, partial [Draconibacterium sp.]|nr:glycoside hydrolase family 3 C-terminal domain-containing protein [Draconibacterium sp.]